MLLKEAIEDRRSENERALEAWNTSEGAPQEA